MQDAVLIQVKDLCRQYGQFHAVDNISFEARSGEVLGFLGPNGAGKTSTMQMLTGNLAPSAGNISINGIDLLQQPKLAKAEIGYLPEQPPLYKELSVDEYLDYCASLHGVAKDKRTQQRNDAKQRCGLNEVGHRQIAHLSKGYQQRVGIAQAIIHLPSIIILDEPTVGLDPIQIRAIRKLIRDLGKEHCVILSTHILPEVQSICDKVQIIHQGKLVLTDTVANLDHAQQHIILLVRFRSVPDVAEIEKLADVISIKQIATTEYQITCASQTITAPLISELAVKNNWGLLELTPQQRTLEELFVEIISAEQSSDKTENIKTETIKGETAA